MHAGWEHQPDVSHQYYGVIERPDEDDRCVVLEVSYSMWYVITYGSDGGLRCALNHASIAGPSLQTRLYKGCNLRG